MAIPTLSPIPQPPSTSDIENFNARADAFLAALPRLQLELTGVINAFNPVFPDIKGLQAIANDLPAVRLVSKNMTSVNATGTGIRSVNTVAGVTQSGALQKVAEANAAIRALSPIALELAELAAHIGDLSAISDKLAQIQSAVQELEAITAATANIAELVALGSNMSAVLGVFANLEAVKAAPSAATQTHVDARAAEQARMEAEAARDAAKGFAESAAGIAGLPVGTENGAPLVWNAATHRWVQGLRTALADGDTPGLAAGDGKTIRSTRGVLTLAVLTSESPLPGAYVVRNTDGEIEGNVTGTATPRAHAMSHAQGGADALRPEDLGLTPSVPAIPNSIVRRNAQGKMEGDLATPPVPASHASRHAQDGPDAITPAALGMVLSIPATPYSIVKRNAQGKIEGPLATPQTPTSHAASHSQSGADPLSLEALGVVISGASPSGTTARLWVQYL